MRFWLGSKLVVYSARVQVLSPNITRIIMVSSEISYRTWSGTKSSLLKLSAGRPGFKCGAARVLVRGGQTFFGTSSLHKSDPVQVASWNHVAMLTESLNISISISRPGWTHSIDWFCEDLSHNYFEDELKIQWKTLILIDFGILADRFSSVSGGCLGFRVGPLWFV